MTAYAPDPVTFAGTNVTADFRTGSASSDSVAAGAVLLVQNTSGATVHNLDLGVNFTYRGAQVSNNLTAGLGKVRYSLPISSWTLIRVPADAGDANGQCSITIDGTATDIKYFVIGA
jgi:hypothetical protein